MKIFNLFTTINLSHYIFQYIQSNQLYKLALTEILPMNPAGYLVSVLTLPSILISLCFTIFLTSSAVRAYFSLFLRNTTRGRHSLDLCGPVPGFGALKTVKRCQWENTGKEEFPSTINKMQDKQLHKLLNTGFTEMFKDNAAFSDHCILP